MTSKKEKTRNKILAVGKKVFYEKGYNDAFLSDIAEECGITKPLISNHFGSKINLATAIYTEYTRAQREAFFKKAEQLTSSSKTEIIIAYRLKRVLYYKEDEKAFRFFSEYINAAAYHDVVPEDTQVANFYEEWPLISSENEYQIDYIVTQFTARALIYHYIIGSFNCDWDTFVDYYTKALFLSSFDSKTIKSVLPQAEKLLYTLDIEYLDNFEWK